MATSHVLLRSIQNIFFRRKGVSVSCCPSIHSTSKSWTKQQDPILAAPGVLVITRSSKETKDSEPRMLLRRFATSRRFFSTNSSHDVAKAIAELNNEMESIFGEPPASSMAGSAEKQIIAQDPQAEIRGGAGNRSVSGLTHIGSTGEAQMVDVSSKETSKRVAVASCKVILGRTVFDLVSSNQMGKGDVLSAAKIAGICGAKQTSNLIPLCHNINLSHVRVDLRLNPDDHSVEIEGEAATSGKTGVEMEALTAVSVAGLTVYDMCKAASKDIVITDVRLESKSGGRSGDWSRQ